MSVVTSGGRTHTLIFDEIIPVPQFAHHHLKPWLSVLAYLIDYTVPGIGKEVENPRYTPTFTLTLTPTLTLTFTLTLNLTFTHTLTYQRKA